jgi:hypothetical protein
MSQVKEYNFAGMTFIPVPRDTKKGKRRLVRTTDGHFWLWLPKVVITNCDCEH